MMIGSTLRDTSLTMSASEVRSSASTQIGHQSTSQSEQQSTGTPLKEDYVPQVGDVVEFEYNGKPSKGLAFTNSASKGMIVRVGLDGVDYGWCTLEAGMVIPTCYKNARKIGEHDLAINGLSGMDASVKAKAYFALEPVKR